MNAFTRTLVLVAIVGLGLRLLFSLTYWTGQPLTRDEREYLSLGRSLAAGRGFVHDPAAVDGLADPFGRAPGYPLFLALAGAGAGAPPTSVPVSVKIAQSFVGAIGVVLAGVLARRLAGPAAGSAAGLVAACYPPLVWIAGYAHSEALIWPIGLALVWLFDRAVAGDGGTRRLATFFTGALAGAAVLIRPAMLFFVALAAVWLLKRRTPILAVVFAVGAAAVLTPWTIRNYREHHRLVLVASEGGVTFWTGNHPLAIGEGDLAANPQLKRESLALRARHPQLSEEQMEPIYYEEAFAWIRAHPWRWLSLEARKVFYFVVPIGGSYRLHSFRYYAASLVAYGLILPAALVGMWQLGRRRRLSPGLWLLAGSAGLTALVFFPQERFRIPIIDPFLIVCAATLFGTKARNESERA